MIGRLHCNILNHRHSHIRMCFQTKRNDRYAYEKDGYDADDLKMNRGKWRGEKNNEIVLALIKIQCENKNFLIVSVLWLQIIGECHSNNTRADRCDESFEKRFVFNGVHKSSLNNNEQKVVSNDIEISPKKSEESGFWCVVERKTFAISPMWFSRLTSQCQ